MSGWWTALGSPFSFTIKNYQNVLSRANMGRSFINSLVISIPATVIPICLASFAAYAFAWMRFKGKEVLFIIVIGLLVVPIQMTVIPVLRLFNVLHLTGTFAGIWLAHAAYGLPFAIYLLRNFIQELPASMLESAFIDGASHPQVFLYLVLGTSLPAIASLAIYQFMWVWNDLFVALIYLGGTPEVAPMTLTMANMVNSYGGGGSTSRRRPSYRWPFRYWSSSRCRNTTSRESWPDRSRNRPLNAEIEGFGGGRRPTLGRFEDDGFLVLDRTRARTFPPRPARGYSRRPAASSTRRTPRR